MIRISHKNIETPIYPDSQAPLILSVENSTEYYRFAAQLKAAFSGEESEFSFWDGDRAIAPERYGELVLSPFYFDAADKRITNLLHKKLTAEYHDGAYITEFNAILAKIEKFLFDLCMTVDFATGLDALSLEGLLKACNVRPSNTFDSLIEKLICYINVLIELKSLSFFVLVGFCDVLSEEELSALYRHCSLMKVGLVLLERGRMQEHAGKEKRIIITEDLCEIVENMPELW